jgi:hypothetical protein
MTRIHYFSPQEVVQRLNELDVDHPHAPPSEQLVLSCTHITLQPGTRTATLYGVWWLRNSNGKIHLATNPPASCLTEQLCYLAHPCSTAREAVLATVSVIAPDLFKSGSQEECNARPSRSPAAVPAQEAKRVTH